jgi:25S rRNA (uracil2843-N3)-methyltransferase
MKDQQLLDVIASCFSTTIASSSLSERLQLLKKHLYNRSFAEAFPTSTDDGARDTEPILEAYIVRWVPTRALCYAIVFENIQRFLPEALGRVVCIGAGCGSESLALQTAFTRQREILICLT